MEVLLVSCFAIEMEAQNAQAGPPSRERPVDLPGQGRLHISEHCPFPGSVHLSYTLRKAHLTVEDTARHVKTLYCKILNLPSARVLRTGCGMLMAKSTIDFAEN